ncbi:hypothetical protein HN814_02540 [Candidatus Woesearchaeota archaeon]|nr:hypothetical protein [Candidatus Woesearchaeota archaeon]
MSKYNNDGSWISDLYGKNYIKNNHSNLDSIIKNNYTNNKIIENNIILDPYSTHYSTYKTKKTKTKKARYPTSSPAPKEPEPEFLDLPPDICEEVHRIKRGCTPRDYFNLKKHSTLEEVRQAKDKIIENLLATNKETESYAVVQKVIDEINTAYEQVKNKIEKIRDLSDPTQDLNPELITNLEKTDDSISFTHKGFYFYVQTLYTEDHNHAIRGHIHPTPILRNQLDFIAAEVKKIRNVDDEKYQKIEDVHSFQRSWECKLFLFERYHSKLSKNVAALSELTMDETIALQKDSRYVHRRNKDTLICDLIQEGTLNQIVENYYSSKSEEVTFTKTELLKQKVFGFVSKLFGRG